MQIKKQLFQGAIDQQYNIVLREIVDMYWTGSLVKEKRDQYFQSVFAEELQKNNPFPIQGYHNLMAVISQKPGDIDSVRVLAAIFLSGQTWLHTKHCTLSRICESLYWRFTICIWRAFDCYICI